MSLPETTTERLLAVADLIETEPERYDQGFYFDDGEDGDCFVTDVIGGKGYAVCNSTACIAGWAVVLSPETLIDGYPVDNDEAWEVAGGKALGLAGKLALCLFDPTFRMPTAEVADILRRLAKLPEGERDVNHAFQVLTGEQAAVLLSGFLIDQVR